MKKNVIIFSLIFAFMNINAQENDGLEIKSFLEKQNLSAKEYVLSLFEKQDIVIICERHHAEIEQYNLFLDIIKDPYFIENVGIVYTECGVSTLTPKLNTFLMSSGLDSTGVHSKVTELYRYADSDFLWYCHSYPWLIKEVYELNQNLSVDKKIDLYGCDIPFDWSKCNTREEFEQSRTMLKDRDSIMADNFAKQYTTLQKERNGKKKALVIMNFRHAFLKDTHNKDDIRRNTGRYIKDKFGEKVASIYLMGLNNPNSWDEYTVVKDGKWDAYIEMSGKTDIGFNIKDTPFGKSTFDVTPEGWSIDKYLYQDIFTGIMFYKSIDEHILKTGWKGAVTEDFLPELKRRIKIMNAEEELTQEDTNFINTEETSKYFNLEEIRKKIDKWKIK